MHRNASAFLFCAESAGSSQQKIGNGASSGKVYNTPFPSLFVLDSSASAFSFSPFFSFPPFPSFFFSAPSSFFAFVPFAPVREAEPGLLSEPVFPSSLSSDPDLLSSFLDLPLFILSVSNSFSLYIALFSAASSITSHSLSVVAAPVLNKHTK